MNGQPFPANAVPPKEQARRVLSQRLALRTSRHAAKDKLGIKGNKTTSIYHSKGTFRNHVAALGRGLQRAWESHGVCRLDDFTYEVAEAVLEELQEALHSKADLNQFVDAWNMARRERFPDAPELSHVPSLVDQDEESRAYPPSDVMEVREYWRGLGNRERRILSLDIMETAGLRVTEPLRIHRIDEVIPSAHRQWDPRRWEGKEDWTRYSVTGKGGLTREFRIPQALVERLEARRLDTPRKITDREIHYFTCYDLEGGQNFTNAWDRAANKVLGYACGAHGLRQQFALLEFSRLIGLGYSRQDARLLLSQTLGHFRTDVVDCYLRLFTNWAKRKTK